MIGYDLYKAIAVQFSPDKTLYIALRNLLGFYPSNIELYKQCFRHKSSTGTQAQQLPSNERLEFLGDAILSGIVGHYLYQRFPYKDEGFLTKMRSKLVSREQLNHVAHKMGLARYIDKRFDNNTKGSSINGDAFEALLGAIYLDKGYTQANRFVVQRVIMPLLDIDQIEQTETDYKSKFIEWAQREKVTYEYKVVEESGQGQQKEFHVALLVNGEEQARATNHSKKRAEQAASKLFCALKQFYCL